MTPRPRATLVACVALAVIAAAVSGRVVRKMVDFEVYWTAAGRAAAAEPLYRAADQHYQFKYLPAFAVLTAPLAGLPLDAAKRLWFIVSAALVALLVSLSLSLPAGRPRPGWLLAAGAVLAMGKFYGHELVLGQLNLLFAVIVVLALLRLRARQHALAGALIALAVVIKPYAVIFLPWLALRRPAAAAAAGIGGLAALLLPVLRYGPSGTLDLHRAWWQTVTGSTAPNLTNNDNVSIAAMYAKWLEPGETAALLALVTGVLLLAVVTVTLLRERPAPFPEGLEGAILLTCIPLLSPQGWDYVFLVATPLTVYLLAYEDRLPGALRLAALTSLAVAGLSLFDVMGRAAYARFMALSIVSVCFLVVVAAGCALRWRRAA